MRSDFTGYSAEYRNMIGLDMPKKIKGWVTLVPCKVCGHKLRSDGKEMWCQHCVERVIYETIAKVPDPDDKKIVYAYYHMTLTELQSILKLDDNGIYKALRDIEKKYSIKIVRLTNSKRLNSVKIKQKKRNKKDEKLS